MANEQNLKPFKKGQTGNPNGRPPGTRNRSTIIKKWLEVNTTVVNPETKEKEAGTVEDKLIIALLGKALKGDVAAAKEIMDSAYGKAQQTTDVTSGGEKINPVMFLSADKLTDAQIEKFLNRDAGPDDESI